MFNCRRCLLLSVLTCFVFALFGMISSSPMSLVCFLCSQRGLRDLRFRHLIFCIIVLVMGSPFSACFEPNSAVPTQRFSAPQSLQSLQFFIFQDSSWRATKTTMKQIRVNYLNLIVRDSPMPPGQSHLILHHLIPSLAAAQGSAVGFWTRIGRRIWLCQTPVSHT